MAALGAEVVLVEQLPNSMPGQVSCGDLELVEAKTRKLVKSREAFRADQFQLEGNFRAYYLNTGREFIVEPVGAASLAGKAVTNPDHRIQGGGYSKVNLQYLKPEYINDFVEVTDEEATETTRELAKQEGIFAGFSSGANIAAAIQLLNGPLKGKTVATTINDSGLKYLTSTSS